MLNEHFAAAQRDLGHGTVLEVDEPRRDEDEQQDQRDHDVVVHAAALVGPEEIAFQNFFMRGAPAAACE